MNNVELYEKMLMNVHASMKSEGDRFAKAMMKNLPSSNLEEYERNAEELETLKEHIAVFTAKAITLTLTEILNIETVADLHNDKVSKEILTKVYKNFFNK